jgi:hypothetical protein
MPSHDAAQPVPKRMPWNKGKLTGPKPPLRTKNVWSIRTKLQVEGRTRDLAMFNFAIDSKLRACDVVRIKVDDVAPLGRALGRVTVRQKKTGQPVTFEMTDQRACRSTNTLGLPARSPAISYSQAAGGAIEVFRRVSTPGSCPPG